LKYREKVKIVSVAPSKSNKSPSSSSSLIGGDHSGIGDSYGAVIGSTSESGVKIDREGENNKTKHGNKSTTAIDPNWYIVCTLDGWHAEVPSSYLTVPASCYHTIKKKNGNVIKSGEGDDDYDDEDFENENEEIDEQDYFNEDHDSYEEEDNKKQAEDILKDRNKWISRDWRELNQTQQHHSNTKTQTPSPSSSSSRYSPNDESKRRFSDLVDKWCFLFKRLKGKHVKVADLFYAADNEKYYIYISMLTLLPF